MKLLELNALAKDISLKVEAARIACESVQSITQEVIDITEPNKPLSNALETLTGSADAIFAAFYPDYINALKAVEVATDALGADLLSNPNVPIG